MTMMFLRAKGYGLSSIQGICYLLNGGNPDQPVPKGRVNFSAPDPYIGHTTLSDVIGPHTTSLIRWGCRTASGLRMDKQVNPSESIYNASNKSRFRMLMRGFCPENSLPTVLSDEVPCPFGGWDHFPAILRRGTHHQGKELHVVDNIDELHEILYKLAWDNWYLTKQVQNRKAEYRVHVMDGFVLSVCKKIPPDENAVAWNMAQGGKYKVLRWGEWPWQACYIALKALQVTNLDFAGVDVIEDEEGSCFILEANTAPSIPLLDDRRVSYNQKCYARGFACRYSGQLPEPRREIAIGGGFEDYIHPAVQNHHDMFLKGD